ncbi:MAG: M23 family metallopeptidase [Bacilli bacterium]|nr:M23 family metallopeptidase [Bacilli bacterium]
MRKLRLKKNAVYGIYAGICLVLLGAIYYFDASYNHLEKNKNDDGYQYVTRIFGEEDQPVINTTEVILRPYTDSNVKVVQSYYDYQADSKEQEGSIVNYENTYMQNNGVAYGGLENDFIAISVLPGTVTSVKEDKLLGIVVEIKNTDKVTTIYQGLKEVNVKENDSINQGDYIGKSSETNLGKDLGKHIVFELKINGNYVNPEKYYDKNVNEL